MGVVVRWGSTRRELGVLYERRMELPRQNYRRDRCDKWAQPARVRQQNLLDSVDG